MMNVMRWNYSRAWSGDGDIRFHRPNARAAPLSAHVVAALADVPVVASRRAFVAEGRAEMIVPRRGASMGERERRP